MYISRTSTIELDENSFKKVKNEVTVIVVKIKAKLHITIHIHLGQTLLPNLFPINTQNIVVIIGVNKCITLAN